MDTQVVPGMVVFGGAGGRSNEGRVNVDGISVGSAFNGAGVSSYIADVGNAREVTMTTSGGLGEAEGGGPSLNIVPKEGGNSLRGSFYAAGVTEGMIGSNYTRRAAQPRPHHAWRDAQGVGLQSRRRRADQVGPRVVLRHVPRRRQRALGPRHVRQRQRRRSDEVDLRRRPDPSGRQRGVVPHDVDAPDRAGHAAQQDRHLLGRAEAVRRRRRGRLLGQRVPHVGQRPRLRRIDGRADAVRIGDARARDRGVPRLRQSRLSGKVDGADDQPAAARSRLRAPTAAAGAAKRFRVSRRRRPDSRRRAVRDRLRGQRQHSGFDVSLGQLVVEHQLEHAVERRRCRS